jgi:hypothetical protein
VQSLDKLKEDPELRARVRRYVEGEIERSKKKGEEEDGSRTPVMVSELDPLSGSQLKTLTVRRGIRHTKRCP